MSLGATPYQLCLFFAGKVRRSRKSEAPEGTSDKFSHSGRLELYSPMLDLARKGLKVTFRLSCLVIIDEDKTFLALITHVNVIKSYKLGRLFLTSFFSPCFIFEAS